MSTRVLYTPCILHTLHTRPGIDSHMSRKNSPTKRRVETSDVRSTHTHTHNNTWKSVLCTRLTAPTSQNKLYNIIFDCVSSPVLVSFLYVVMCPDTQTQNSHSWITNDCNLTRDSCIESLQSWQNVHKSPLYSVFQFRDHLSAFETCGFLNFSF